MRIPNAPLRLASILWTVCLAACAGPGTQESAQPPPAGASSGLPSASPTATAATPLGSAAAPPASGAPTASTAPSGAPTAQAAPSGTASAGPPPGPHIGQMASGKLSLTGYVVNVYKCPPCPPKAMCKPCIGDHVVVSDSPSPIDGFGHRGPTDAVVFVDAPKINSLTVGKKYHFEITLTEGHLITPTMNDIQMVSASPIK